jgi:caa(3)-type oxidase subunit IV
MTDPHHTEEHHGPDLKAYLWIFGGLTILTLITFLAYMLLVKTSSAPKRELAVTIIMIVAVCKAALVAVYYMHLILDWKKVYILIVPALILGPMLVVVLLPDIVLAWKTTGGSP